MSEFLSKVRLSESSASPPTCKLAWPWAFATASRLKTAPRNRLDALNTLCFHYAVPKLYGEFNWTRRSGGFIGWLFSPRRNYKRFGLNFPCFFEDPASREITPASTEDLNRKALAVIMRNPPSPGTERDFVMYTPVGEIRGRGKVLRNEPRMYAGRPYFLCAFEFVSFEGSGQVSLLELCSARSRKSLALVMQPRRKLRPIRMRGRVTAATFAIAPFVLLVLLLFRFVNADDFFLRDIGNYPAEQDRRRQRRRARQKHLRKYQSH